MISTATFRRMVWRKFLISATSLFAIAGCQNSSSQTSAGRETATAGPMPRPDPDLARLKNATALDLIRHSKYDAAEQVLQMAIEADVAFGPAHNSLGTVYLHQNKLYQAAWEFQYAAKLMPTQPEPRNNLGLIFERVGKLDDAISEYQSAVHMEPDNPRLLCNLARARIARGDTDDDVKKLLDDIILKDDRAKWVDWAKERLQFLGRSPSSAPAS